MSVVGALLDRFRTLFFFRPLLFRYIFREMVVPFLLSVGVLTGVLFIARVLKLVDLVVNKSIPLFDVVLLFSYVVPGFLEMAIPMALLLGILLAFSRLSADSELVVIRAAGVSFRQLLVPPFVFSLIMAAICLGLSFWVRPIANYKLGMGMFEIAKERASAGLPSGVFTEFGPLTMYAEQVDSATGHLQNVLISDRRDPVMPRNFFAQWGEMISDPKSRTLSLRLFDGSIHEGTGNEFTVTRFSINNIRLPQDELLDPGESRGGNRPSEMPISELNARLRELEPQSHEAGEPRKQWIRASVELQRRLALPFSCLTVSLLGVALGVQPARGTRTWGTTANTILGIAFILIYYLALALGSAIAEHNGNAIALFLWLPNVVFLLVSLYLLRQIETERWQAVSQALGDSVFALRSKFSRKKTAK